MLRKKEFRGGIGAIDCLETSTNLYRLLDNPLFDNISVEGFIHTMILFSDAEDVFDTLVEMATNYDDKFYAKDKFHFSALPDDDFIGKLPAKTNYCSIG